MLNLAGNKLEKFANYQINNNLRVLNLSKNNLRAFGLIGFLISERTSLEHLDLSCNKLEHVEFDAVFGFKTNATVLLNGNRIQKFVYANSFLSKIRHLNLESNVLSRFEMRVENLTVLDLCNNFNVEVNAEFLGKFANSGLAELYLSNTNLKLSKDMFKNLSKLTVLNVSNNRYIDSLSGEYLSGLESLEHLHANGCLISQIEKNTFADLNELMYLDLSWNKLAELRQDTFQGCSCLIALNLSNNQKEMSIEPNSFDLLPCLFELVLPEGVQFKRSENSEFFVKYI